MSLTLKPQEIPFDHPESKYTFRLGPNRPLVSTPAAIEMFRDRIVECLIQLQRLAAEQNGIDRLQVFEDPEKPEVLWFIDDGPTGQVTALLPSDY